jgi:hypothetical protein
METGLIELFVHAKGRSQTVQGAPGDTLSDVLVRLEIIEAGALGDLIFIGECEEALAEPDDLEDGEDNHPAADINLTLEILDLKRHRHVHHHPCRHIAVAANFGGKTKHHRFSTAATVETVTRWARKKFHVDPATAAEYVLQFCGSTVQPRSDQHLSQLVEALKCSLCFDLVPEVTPQG